MADEDIDAPRKSRKEKLKKIKEQIAAMNECEDIQNDNEEESCSLADELQKIKDRIRKRNDEAILATCPK
jgi:hypothetical protein